MANRFETPIDSQFVNTYVPIPFAEMMQAGQMKQQRYDAGAAAIDQSIQNVEMINAISNSVDEQYKNQAIQSIYDIRDRYADKDLSDSFVTRQMNTELSKNVDKNRLQKIEASYSRYNAAQEAKRTLAMNNKWNPLLDKDPGQALGDYAGWDSRNGEYNYNPTAYVDKADLFNPYYKDLGSESMGVVTLSDGTRVLREGISDAKIKAVSNTAAQELASTPQGQQQVELYRMSNPTSELSDVQILQNQMYDYGKQFRSSNDQVLAANTQAGGSGTSSADAAQNILKNIMAAQDTVTGATPTKKINAINDEYEAAKAALTTLDPTSPDYIKNQGIVSKIDEARQMGELAARAINDPKIQELKTVALNKLKAIPEFSQIPEEVIIELIDQQFAPGFSAGAARFGNALHQTEDKIGGAIPALGKQLFNILGAAPVKKGMAAFNPEKMANAITAAVDESGITEDWSLGDAINLLWKANKNLNKEAGTWNGVSDMTRNNRDRDERNILRDVVKEVNQAEKQIKESTDEYVLGQMQHMVSKKQLYPIVTKSTSGRSVIMGADGVEYDSDIERVLTNLPVTMDGFEIRQLDKGVYKPLSKKETEEARVIAATWDRPEAGAMVEAGPDENGNTVLRVSYTTPKGEGTPTLKQYEIKLPMASDEARKVALDYMKIGTRDAIKTGIRLADPNLKKEIETYIDAPNGHSYQISDGQDVRVDRVNGEYIITVNGEKSNPYKYKEQVEDALYSLKAVTYMQ